MKPFQLPVSEHSLDANDCSHGFLELLESVIGSEPGLYLVGTGRSKWKLLAHVYVSEQLR